MMFKASVLRPSSFVCFWNVIVSYFRKYENKNEEINVNKTRNIYFLVLRKVLPFNVTCFVLVKFSITMTSLFFVLIL